MLNHWRQYDDENSSTRYCICGSSIEWSGADDRLERWKKRHKACGAAYEAGRHEGKMEAERGVRVG